VRKVNVVYHCEDGNWWADSPDDGLETFVAGGRSFEETRRLAWEGLEFHLEEEVSLIEVLEDGAPVDAPGYMTARAVVALTGPGDILAKSSTSSRAVTVPLAQAPGHEELRPMALEVA